METPQGPEAQVGEQSLLGNNGRKRSEVSSSLRIDTQQLSTLKQHLKEARDITKQWRQEMEKLSVAAKNVQGAMQGAAAGGGAGGGGGGGSSPATSKAAKEGPNSSKAPTAPPSRTATALGMAGGVMSAIAPIVGGGVRQLDSRIDRGIAYATSADRLNLLTQQMTGMSQMQAMQQRQGLTEYRLGAGGINAATQFGLSTGQTITPQMARSIEAIRTSTGFSKTTADILTEQRQLMDPTVANRMFFMTGVNAFNIGGGMKDPLQMRQEIVQRMGLTNETVLKGALAPGSVTRARMADLGIGEEMQTEFLQYAQQQMAFRDKGGKGFYDPSKASHRQMMGIEDNLATQQEETERVTAVREEQFMRRQVDNMAALEKSNQQLIAAMASLEDTMSGLIGGRISTRPKQQMVGGLLRGVGGAMAAIGGAMSLTGVGATIGAPMAAIGGGMYLAGSALGDPPETKDPNTPTHTNSAPASDGSRDHELMVPSAGRGSPRIPLSEFKNTPRFTQLDSRLKEKLLRMMRENPNVGINSGYRSAADQERLFYQQMEETTPEQSQIEWNGKHWKSKEGYSFTAPPGRSMHETGLAADIFEDGDGRSYEWIVANSGRFGLNNWRAKGWRHDEPWHVQPEEVPRFRSEWDRMTGGQSTYSPTSDAATNDSSGESDGASVTYSADTANLLQTARGPVDNAGALFNPSGMTIEEAMQAARDLGVTRLMASGSGGWNEPLVAAGAATKGGGSSVSRSVTGAYAGGRQLTGEEVARFAYNAGFRGEDLVKVVAISKRESGWQTGAYNPDRSTNDDSYGLMQINMLGNMGPSRREWFGISSNEDLYDPQTNMNAAFMLYQNRGNKLDDWGAYKGESNTYATDMSEALTVVTNAGYETGDPMISTPSRRSSSPSREGRSGTTHITSSPTINVAPVINFNGAPSTPDLRNIAQTVSRLIKEEVDMIDLRTA